MRKNVFAGSMLLLACVALVACTTDSGEEVQYVKIGQNLCSFLAEGNQPLEIDVKASPAEWTVEMGASWVKAERTDDRTQIEDGSVPFRQGVHARLYLSRRKFVEDRRRYGAAEVRRAHFIGSLQRVPAAEIGHDRIDEYPSAPTLERSVAAVVAYARIERHETVVQQVFRRGSVAHIAPYDAIHRTAVAYVQFAASLRVPPAATLYYLFQCQRRSVIR